MKKQNKKPQEETNQKILLATAILGLAKEVFELLEKLVKLLE